MARTPSPDGSETAGRPRGRGGRAPFRVRRVTERREARRRIEARPQKPLTPAQRAFNPLARTRASRARRVHHRDPGDRRVGRRPPRRDRRRHLEPLRRQEGVARGGAGPGSAARARAREEAAAARAGRAADPAAGHRESAPTARAAPGGAAQGEAGAGGRPQPRVDGRRRWRRTVVRRRKHPHGRDGGQGRRPVGTITGAPKGDSQAPESGTGNKVASRIPVAGMKYVQPKRKTPKEARISRDAEESGDRGRRDGVGRRSTPTARC